MLATSSACWSTRTALVGPWSLPVSMTIIGPSQQGKPIQPPPPEVEAKAEGEAGDRRQDHQHRQAVPSDIEHQMRKLLSEAGDDQHLHQDVDDDDDHRDLGAASRPSIESFEGDTRDFRKTDHRRPPVNEERFERLQSQQG